MNAVVEAEIIAGLECAYSIWGTRAVYRSDDITVLRLRQDTSSEGNNPEYVSPDLSVRVRISEVEDLERGDILTVDDVDYIVADNLAGSQWEWNLNLVRKLP